ncbi:MAG: PE-PPE domain-containing protein [Mycobacterium sp.]
MRKAVRAFLVASLGFLSAVVIGAVAVLTSAITLAATALIVPGTGTHNIVPPNAVTGYMENARTRFITPADPGCPDDNAGCVLTGIPYPASFWPIPIPGWCPGLSCDTWNQSVATGVTNLNSQLINELMNPTPENQQLILFGYSQGGQVVTNEMYNLAGLDDATKARIQVVTIGNIGNPQGLWSRFNLLPGLTVPILNVTFGPQLPTDIGIKSTNFAFEYDPVGDAPLNWWNGLAVLNALAAFEYVHGYYLVPNSNDPTDALPYGYTDATLAQTIDGLLSNCTEGPGSNCRTYQDAKFVLIPWQGTLPLLQPVMDLADSVGITPIVKPLVDLFQPALKVLIDLGYDRVANPGIPRTLNVIPTFNPIKLAVDLVVAAGQGIEAFIHDITGSASSPPAPVAPLAPKPSLTFAPVADNSAKIAQTEQAAQNEQTEQNEQNEPSKPDPKNPSRRHLPDASVLASQAKIDPKPETEVSADPKPETEVSADPKPDADLGANPKPMVDATLRDPKPDADGSSNPAFKLPKRPHSAIGSATAPKQSKLPKPGNLSPPRVTDLFPKLRGAQNGQVGTETAAEPGAGEQQQGTPPSSNDGQQAAA